MRLKLPITLVSVDCVTPLETIQSIRYTLKSVQFDQIVLVTDETKISQEIFDYIESVGITATWTRQGGRLDYEDFVLRKLHTCFSTSHCLFQEWDSAVINPAAWNSSWLDFDYIGAPWPPGEQAQLVGNGGFSIRSHALCAAVASMIPEGEPGIAISDTYICIDRRAELEAAGFKFAPYAEAWKFSCENRFYAGEFGAHGKKTIAMNGWKWELR